VPGGSKRSADDFLVTALASGASVVTAAAKAEVSERTVRRRLEDPAFRARVDEARGELVRQAVSKLADIGALAGETLGELVREGSGAVRLGAARSILEFMFRGHELDTLARQVEELRRELGGVKRVKREAPHGNEPAAEVGSHPAGGSADTPAGTAEGGPGPDPDPGGDATGRVAAGPPPLF
jgi:hypothetical protein